MDMKIRKVMVLGSGLMETGISQTSTQYGYSVILYNLYNSELEVSISNIGDYVTKLIQKGKLSEPKEQILQRIKTTTKVEEGNDADLVIESVVENL
jgi:3-hydroxybutyryl-CoA dehydrogenase